MTYSSTEQVTCVTEFVLLLSSSLQSFVGHSMWMMWSSGRSWIWVTAWLEEDLEGKVSGMTSFCCQWF